MTDTSIQTEDRPVMSDVAKTRRADAERNRQRLLDSAAAAFGAGDDPPLEAIARAAGVGIGTLYRHFPGRESLVEAVYRAELAALCEGVDELLDRQQPPTALRTFMGRYADFVATKRGMADTLRAIVNAGTVTSAQTREALDGAAGRIIRAGADTGTIRSDVEPDDIVTILVGIFLATEGAQDRSRVDRLMDLLLSSVRTQSANQ